MATILEEERETVQASPVRMEVTDGLAVITLNDPARPVNVISEALLREMGGLIDRLENGEAGVRAAVIVSAKKGTWIAGADIEEFKHFKTPADAGSSACGGRWI